MWLYHSHPIDMDLPGRYKRWPHCPPLPTERTRLPYLVVVPHIDFLSNLLRLCVAILRFVRDIQVNYAGCKQVPAP